MCVRGNAHMKGKKIITMPKRHVIPPPGYFLAQIGETIYCFDAEGNKKPRAEVLSLDHRKKAPQRASSKRPPKTRALLEPKGT